MISRILLYVLLSKCIYTYTVKSIKDNNDTYFQKFPDNLNFETKPTLAVKKYIEVTKLLTLKSFLKKIFGNAYILWIDQKNLNYDDMRVIVNRDLLDRLKRCRTPEGIRRVFNSVFIPGVAEGMDRKKRMQIVTDFEKS